MFLSRAVAALMTCFATSACIASTAQPCAPPTVAQDSPTAKAGTKQAAEIQWWITVKDAEGQFQSHEVGRDKGKVPLPPNATEAECTYDGVTVESEREFRWVRCFGSDWMAQTIAACSLTHYTPSGPDDPNLGDARSNSDESVLVAGGKDGKPFGVGIKCETKPKTQAP